MTHFNQKLTRESVLMNDCDAPFLKDEFLFLFRTNKMIFFCVGVLSHQLPCEIESLLNSTIVFFFVVSNNYHIFMASLHFLFFFCFLFHFCFSTMGSRTKKQTDVFSEPKRGVSDFCACITGRSEHRTELQQWCHFSLKVIYSKSCTLP